MHDIERLLLCMHYFIIVSYRFTIYSVELLKFQKRLKFLTKYALNLELKKIIKALLATLILITA